MEDPLPPPQLDVAKLLHLVSTPSDFEYEFEPEDFDLLEKIVATDPQLQQIVDSVQRYLLQKMSMPSLIPMRNVSSMTATASTDADLRHYDGCAAASDNKPDDVPLVHESRGSTLKVDQSADALQHLLSPIPQSGSSHCHNTKMPDSYSCMPKDMHRVQWITGSAHCLQQTYDTLHQPSVLKTAQNSVLVGEHLRPTSINAPSGHGLLLLDANDVSPMYKSADSKYSQPVMEKLEPRKLSLIEEEDVIIIDDDEIIIDEDVIIIDPDPIHIQEVSENPDGVDRSVSKAGSDISASKKKNHSKDYKDQKMIKALHKKQKEIASANQQAPTPPPSNSACALELDQDTDCQIIAVQEAPPAAYRHAISTATKHKTNNRKRQAVKEVSIPSSLGFMDETLPKREYKPLGLESECTRFHPLNNPQMVEKTSKKTKKRKNGWGEDSKITIVPQKCATPLYSEDTNRLPTLCKEHFLDAKNESIPSKKTKTVSAETISAINEFMKTSQPVHNAPLRKCQVVPHYIKDPIIDYFASCKMPKRPSLGKDFPATSHEKQIITGHPAENIQLTMDFAGQRQVCGRMPHNITPCVHYPQTIHGPSNRHLPCSFRVPIEDGSYQISFIPRPYEWEAPAGAFPGQGAIYERMAQASMPDFPTDQLMQVLSNHPQKSNEDI